MNICIQASLWICVFNSLRYTPRNGTAGSCGCSMLNFLRSIKLLPKSFLHSYQQHAAAKSLQSCPTLCDPIDSSPPGSPVPGILHTRTLEWVAIAFSNAWKWKVKVKSLSHVRLSVIPWTAAHQAPPSMVFSRVLEWGAIAFSKWGPHSHQIHRDNRRVGIRGWGNGEL